MHGLSPANRRLDRSCLVGIQPKPPGHHIVSNRADRTPGGERVPAQPRQGVLGVDVQRPHDHAHSHMDRSLEARSLTDSPRTGLLIRLRLVFKQDQRRRVRIRPEVVELFQGQVTARPAVQRQSE